jgi:hypothetical protein
MNIWRKVKVVWRLYAESQPRALGISPLEEFVRFDGNSILAGDRCALVFLRSAGAGRAKSERVTSAAIIQSMLVAPLLLAFQSAAIEGYFTIDLGRVSRASSQTAQQGARANADICHAACDRKHVEMKNSNPDPIEARGAPDAVVAHL